MYMRSKVVAATLAVVVAVIAMAAPAFAHVTVNPNEATKGGFTKLTFRVPNEEDAADTVSVAVSFDQAHPISSVSVKPKAGWTIDVEKSPLPTPVTNDDGGTITEAVSKITWSGGTIAPGQFDEFDVSVGPLPDDVDSLQFPAIQTYSDGTVVQWIQQSVEGQPEPDHPVPTLKLTAAGDDTGHGSTTSSDSGTAAASTSTAHGDTSDSSARTLGAVGIVLGAIGVVLGGLSYANLRRSR
jgi:uncharacterized protein YcnI